MAQPPHLPGLPALRAFEATVRLGSVSKAARELNVTDGAVSRAVRDMEDELGFSLFQRSNRSVVPTATARVLADDISGALDRLRHALARARRTSGPERPLVLSCEPTFLIRWLIPRLDSLQAAIGPGRELRLVSAGGAVPFGRQDIDLAIRRTDFPLPDDVVAEPFLDEKVGPVCRPDLAAALAGSGPVQGVLLHSATRPSVWADWARLSQARLQASRETTFEHFYLSLQAAAAGMGIAMGPVALVADDLANGTLAAPRGLLADGTRYVLMKPAHTGDTEAFNAILAWLRSMALGMEPPIEAAVEKTRQQA